MTTFIFDNPVRTPDTAARVSVKAGTGTLAVPACAPGNGTVLVEARTA